MDYKAIITQGLRNDSGSMDMRRVISRGYWGVIGSLITVTRNITALFSKTLSRATIVAKRVE